MFVMICNGLTVAIFFLCFYGIFIVCYKSLFKKNIKSLTNNNKRLINYNKRLTNMYIMKCLFHVCKSLSVARYIYCFKLDHSLLRGFVQKNTNGDFFYVSSLIIACYKGLFKKISIL